MDAPEEEPGGRALRVRPLWLLLAAVLLLAALLRPQQLLTTLTSPRALLVLLGLVLLTLLLRRVTRALPRPVAAGVSALPGLLALLLLVVPTLRSTSVDEGLDGLADLRGDAVAVGQSEAGTGTGTDTGADTASGTGTETGTETQAEAPADAPVRVSTSVFEGIGHRATGSASLVRLSDGELLVRLEDLDVDPGPDYRLVLVPGAGQEAPGEAGQELGRLKATSGNQNYPLEQAPPAQPFTVLIWCEAFSVPVAAATLA